MRKIALFAGIAGLIVGAGIAAVSEGSFWNGWLAAGGLSSAAIFGLGAAWRWTCGKPSGLAHRGSRWLGILMATAFMLRLGIGILMSLGLQTYGYNETVQRAGFVYADAYTRDHEAWTSDKPIWASFQQEFLSDQYGGSLALSALIYRVFSPDAHRRFLFLILTAFTFCVGLPFFWKTVRDRWNEPLANLSSWILVLYPESILVGASQMREPFLLGLTMIAFWAVFSWGRQRVRSTLIFLVTSALMLAFSSRAAVMLSGTLLVCGWFEWMDKSVARRWRWLGWGVLGVAAVALVGLSWNWLKLAAAYDVGLSIRQSGMIQVITTGLPEILRTPFVTVYGLAQPVLPAALVDPAPLIWKIIAILRASGWYALAPFLLYAAFTCWRAQPSKDRQILIWMALGGLMWLVLSSMRAGGDQWDNPRYRVLFLPFIALVTAWGWRWSRLHKDTWIWAWGGADGIFTAFFLSWYLSRYTGAFGKLSFWLMIGLILAASSVLMAAGWIWNVRRKGQSIRTKLQENRARLSRFLALQPAGTPSTSASRPLPRVVQATPYAVQGTPYAVQGTPCAVQGTPCTVQDVVGHGAGPTASWLAGLRANKGRFNRWDALILVGFLAFASLYFLGRLQSNFPILVLTGDAGNITSFAAAQAHPELFRGDPVLGEANRTGFYATVHVPLIKALAPLAGGDFAWAYTWLVLPHIFLQLLGFYILGRVLFKNRFWALLLALLTAMPFLDVGVGEFWGIWRDAIPRVTFQTALPYLLALVVVWRDRPRRWPWLMIAAGLMVFFHSISAPAWGLAIWLGLWLYHPAGWKWPRRVGVMAGLGLLFLVALSPFAFIFLSYQSRGATSDYDLIMTIINTFQPKNILNVGAALGDFLWAATRSLLLPLALIGFAAVWHFGRADRKLVKMVLLWVAGILITAILIPAGERVVEGIFRIPPIDTELVRGMRYLVPLMLLFWLWPLAVLEPRLINLRAAQSVLLIGVVLLGGWTATHTPEGRKMLDAAACLGRGRLVCGEIRDSAGMITALRTQTPPGARIFDFSSDDASASGMLSIRYAALRPLVYTVRDAGLFLYMNRAAYGPWLEITRQVDEIQALQSAGARLDRLVPLAQQMQADYLVVDFLLAPSTLAAYPADLVWQNKTYSLIRLRTP